MAVSLNESLRLIRDATATEADLSYKKIGDDVVQQVGGALKTNSILTKLNLKGNAIGNDGARYLADALRVNTALTELNLDENSIETEGACCLADALKINISLTTLYLNVNMVGNDGACYLADALKTNTTLTTLYLNGNIMGADGARYLADALKTNTVLTTLSLTINNSNAVGAHYLADALKINTALTTLYLDYNRIGIDGARYLADALKTNTSLTTLYLGGNAIGDDGARALADSFKDNAVLTKIDLSDNNIRGPGQQALAEGLVHQYSTLKMLVLVSFNTFTLWESLQASGSLAHVPVSILQDGIYTLIDHLKRLTLKISRRRTKLFVMGNEKTGKTPILDMIMTGCISCLAVYCLHDIICVAELTGSCLTLYQGTSLLHMTVLTKEWTKDLVGNRLILAPPKTANDSKIVLTLLPSDDTTVFLSCIDHVLHEHLTPHGVNSRRFSIKDHKGSNVEVSAWDFRCVGQLDYHENLNRYFMRDQTLYLVVWDMTKRSSEDDSNDLLFWLRSLHARLPSPTENATDRTDIIIVGTHLDLLPPDERDPAGANRKSRDRFVHETAAKAGLTQSFEIVEISSSEAPLFLGHDQLRGLVSSAAGRLAGDGKLVPDSCIAIELLIDEIATTKKNQGQLPIMSVSDLYNHTRFPAKAVKCALEILNTWGHVIYQPDVSDLIILDPAAFLVPGIMDELLRPFQSVTVQGRLPLHYLDLLWQQDSSLVARRDAILSLMERFGVCHIDPGTDTVIFSSRHRDVQ